MSSSPTTAQPPRRKIFSFSLRALLIAMLFFGLVAAWFGREYLSSLTMA